jgi:alpha-mannosidase
MFRFHLLGNSHLDPVWLWDWREGLNEAIITCRTVLDLMDEYPELTYIRGETATYEHIQRHDPGTFARILAQIGHGRWDVVGGTFIQPDTNLPATETLVRHFTRGLTYCESVLKRRPTVAWAADSFGHSAGWPAIFAAAGIDAYTFSRPFEPDLHLENPAFWWEGDAGQRVLAWRMPSIWYGTERDEIMRRLDDQRARAHEWGVENIGIFYGLGNHGGGPTRRQLRDIRQWSQANPDVTVIHSGLHRFFADLRAEKGVSKLPVFRGELNFTLRGCYSSATRFKAAYRRAESLLQRAEKTVAAIAAAGVKGAAVDLAQAWDAVLFNTFHDILPGTSIEHAFEDQTAWMGVAYHDAQRAETAALNALALTLHTTVNAPAEDMPAAVPILVWNPHPHPFDGIVEIEAAVDYRPIPAYKDRPQELPVELLGPDGEPRPFQSVAVEHMFSLEAAWRVRVVLPLQIPSLGWQVVSMAWNETPRLAAAPAKPVAAGGDSGEIHGGDYRVRARMGESGIHIFCRDEPLFGEEGLMAVTMEDAQGSWGGAGAAAGVVSPPRAVWKIEQVEMLEKGPERAVLWVRLGAETSRLELTFGLVRGARKVDISGRVIWNERAARLKLLFPSSGQTEYEVPGGAVSRADNLGEVSGGRWVRAARFAFLSDAIYNFGLSSGVLSATIVRCCRYAASNPLTPDEFPAYPYMDLGEHRFRAALTFPDADLVSLADFLEQPPIVGAVAAHAGSQPKTGSFGELLSPGVRMLAFKPAEDGRGFILRLQGTAGKSNPVRFRWLKTTLKLGTLARWEIGSWRMTGKGGKWKATPTLADEVKKA